MTNLIAPFFCLCLLLPLSLAADEASSVERAWLDENRTQVDAFVKAVRATPRLYSLTAFKQDEAGFCLNRHCIKRTPLEKADAFAKRVAALCSAYGFDPRQTLTLAVQLADLGLGHFAYVYGHDRHGHPLFKRPARETRAIGIQFFPPYGPEQAWYFSLNGKPPPETALYGVIEADLNWFWLTP